MKESLNNIKQWIKNINWQTNLYLILSPILSIYVIYYYSTNQLFKWETILLAIFMWFASGMAITVGYHRYFSHRSYKTKKWIEYLYVFFGTSAMEMSIAEWAYDHRNHHRYTDTEKDPYSIKKGFWYAHISWLFTNRGTEGGKTEMDFKKISDLWKDPFIRFQYKYFTLFAIFSAFIFPGMIASLWGDFWGGVLIAGLVRSVIVHHGTFSINSVCHMIGKRPYSLEESARDSWISALLTFGEGYHNFHHKFPGDYRNAIRFWQYDPSKWFIWTLSKLGLSWDLHRTPQERILQAKWEVWEQTLQQKNINLSSEMLTSIKQKFFELVDQISKLRKEYESSYENKKEILNQKIKELQDTYKNFVKLIKHSIDESIYA